MKFLTSCVLLLSVLLLGGCKVTVPAFDLASVHGQEMKERLLSPAQTEALRGWLETRKSGWEFHVWDTPLHLFVSLTKEGKSVGTLHILPAHVGAKNYYLPITPAERTELLRLIGVASS